MRANDRTLRTPNHTRLTPAQRRLASLVRTLRRAQVVECGQTDGAEALAPAVAAADWGPFGSFFVTVSRPYWAGVEHTYKTIWSNRRPVMTVRVWANGTHTLEKCFTPSEGEEYFQKARGKRRELAAQASEHARRVRRILGRATPAQRAYMYEMSWEDDVAVLVAKHGDGAIGEWEFDGSFFVKGVERLPAHAAIRKMVSKTEVARTVRDLEIREEHLEREAARARAAGVARIGRGIAEAAWQAVCLAREEASLEAVRGLRRIHA